MDASRGWFHLSGHGDNHFLSAMSSNFNAMLKPKDRTKCKGLEEEYLLTDAETCLWWQWDYSILPQQTKMDL